MMDRHLNRSHHCTSICFLNDSYIWLEKLLEEQSCADDWWQHIKGLCGSAVSINGLFRSFLPPVFTAQSYIITMGRPATKHQGQTFKGNRIGSKQRYHCYSQHQRQSIAVSCPTYRSPLSVRSEITLRLSFIWNSFHLPCCFAGFVSLIISVTDGNKVLPHCCVW